jgi:hypothetical protein
MRFLFEAYEETDFIHYDDLEITVGKETSRATYWEPADYDSWEETIEWDYEVPKQDIEEEIADLMSKEDFPTYINIEDDEQIYKYIDDNYDELYAKFEKQLKERFRDNAIYDAEENYEYDEYEPDYDDLDESFESKEIMFPSKYITINRPNSKLIFITREDGSELDDEDKQIFTAISKANGIDIKYVKDDSKIAYYVKG